MNGRALVALAIFFLAVVLMLVWQRSHHRSADQEILLRKAHQH